MNIANKLETLAESVRLDETIAMFRFNDEEIEKYRDGFSVAQSGITGVSRFLIETFFLTRKGAEADTVGFGEEVNSLTKKQWELQILFYIARVEELEILYMGKKKLLWQIFYQYCWARMVLWAILFSGNNHKSSRFDGDII